MKQRETGSLGPRLVEYEISSLQLIEIVFQRCEIGDDIEHFGERRKKCSRVNYS